MLVELQQHISKLDVEGYNILTDDYREQYFQKVVDEVKKYCGKIYLYKHDNQIVGIIVGIINNDEIETYDFKAPKRGRITELVVSNNIRCNGVGSMLLNAMEQYLKSVGCKDVILSVFAYNEKAIKFYAKNGYHSRLVDMTKSI